MTDGLTRGINIPVPQVADSSDFAFQAEGISGTFEYDTFGRSESFVGGASNPVRTQMEYFPDHKEREDAGLLKRSEYGKIGQPSFWTEFEYDDQYNVEERRTSQGTTETADYDSWDRIVSQTAGRSDGRYRSVGAAECGEGGGAKTERAFDAAGHVIRERRLQDYVASDGSIQCRWIETRYTYNAREQIVSTSRTHLSDPLKPGHVTNGLKEVQTLIYDESGRLFEDRSKNSVNPDLVTRYRYDEAGRVAGVKTGDAGEVLTGYDVKNRVALWTDGDEGVSMRRFDAWDRPYWKETATGAYELVHYDKAGHPVEATVWDADPLAPSGSAVLQSQTKTRFTSFGEADRIVQVLIDDGQERQIHVTEVDFDDLGRVEVVLSGPAKINAEELDRSQARREEEIIYEPETGRILEKRYGGDPGQSALHAVRYSYHPDNGSPWFDSIETLESVPGEDGLVKTRTTSFQRDAYGRVIEARKSDGTFVRTTYDRGSGQVIRVRRGNESETRFAFDAAGRQIRIIRPNDRGQTLYAYDLDGRLLEQVVTTADGDPWETKYTWDRTGRVIQIDHEDGTQETKTYNLDSTVATSTTRDGVEITFTYDEGNREVAATPRLTRGPPASLAPLDVGDSADYDVLSRLVEMRRGSAGSTETDPALTVRYPRYDLASRAVEERVGSRQPLTWRYDEWSRDVEIDLPEGLARRSGSFQGFRQQFDTLDRRIGISALGGELTMTPAGATFAWGGVDRLYSITTRGA